MNERVKGLRAFLGLTQEEFGKKLGFQKSQISRIESGLNNITDQTQILICREFGVNEIWLRTGEGEMFVTMSRDEELAEWAGRLVSSGTDNEFMKKFVHVLSKLDIKEWESLEKIALLMAEETKKV